MVLDNSLRNKAKQSDIIVSIIERLIDQIDDLNSQNCFLCDQPIPAAHPGGRFCVTVSIGGGRFPHEFFAGGGTETLIEDSAVVITPIIISKLDRPYQFVRRILGRMTDDRTPGLLATKEAILAALLSSDWEPNKAIDDETEAPLLRDMLSPISCDDPHDTMVGESPALAMKMRFATVFDWDLSNA